MNEPTTALDRLREDLAFAAPEVWMLHIQRRMEEAAEEARTATLARLRTAVEGLPTVSGVNLEGTGRVDFGSPLTNRDAVLALIDGADAEERGP